MGFLDWLRGPKEETTSSAKPARTSDPTPDFEILGQIKLLD